MRLPRMVAGTPETASVMNQIFALLELTQPTVGGRVELPRIVASTPETASVMNQIFALLEPTQPTVGGSSRVSIVAINGATNGVQSLLIPDPSGPRVGALEFQEAGSFASDF